MQLKVYESELVWNATTIISTVVALFNILLMLFIFYFAYKLLGKVIDFLKKN